MESLCSCLKQSCHTSSNAHSKNCEGSPFAFVIHTVSSACIIRNTSPEALPTSRATRGGFHPQSNCTPRTLSCQGKYSQSYLETPTASLYEHSFVEKTVLLVFPFSRKMFAKVLAVHIVSSRIYCPKSPRKLLRYSTSIFLSRRLPSKYLQALRTQYESRKMSLTYWQAKICMRSPTTLLSIKRSQ